jgi:hypothetical protein
MTANGVMHCVLETAKTTLGKCRAWQTWTGVGGTEAAALARIYLDALPKPASNAETHTLAELQSYRPYIILTDGTDGGFTMLKHAVGGGFSQKGMIMAEINADVPTNIANDLAAVRRAFRISLGNLLRSDDIANPGLAELAETPGCLAINRVEVIGPARTSEEDISELGDAQRAWLEIHWGHVQ